MSEETSLEAKQRALYGEYYKELNVEELFKIREQIRDAVATKNKIAMELYASHINAERMGAFQYSKEYGQNAIKCFFLLNGGAVIALLTFIGSMYGKSDVNILVAITLGKKLVPAFTWFVVGLVATALASAVSYFNWQWIASSYPAPHEIYEFLHAKPLEPDDKTDSKIRKSYVLALLLGAIPIIAFVAGASKVMIAFSVLGF